MKTSARSIAQTTKYRTPSVWNPLAAVRHREENWFYFPEPSMVLKKEEEGEEQDSQMFSLLFQLLNYDFSSKNQYFIKLEMQPLLQELNVIMTRGAREEKIILEKINQVLQEILCLREVHEDSGILLSYVENMKHEASVLMEQLVKKQSVYHTSVQVTQNTENQIRKLEIRPAAQMQINANHQISVYENQLSKPFAFLEKHSTSERWKNDIRHLQTIYENMSKDEKESFLQEISVTETELLSTQTMTREQWEVFLTKVLPLMSSYVKKQEAENEELLETQDVFHFITNLTQAQWQHLKVLLTQDVRTDYANLYAYFKAENQEQHTSSENWMQEKQNFVSYIQKNQYTSLFKTFLSNTDFMDNNVLLSEKKKATEAKEVPFSERSGEKLAVWISHLTKNKWQEVQNIFEIPEESYAAPHLESVQIKPSAEQLFLTEEIQRMQKHIQKNNISASEPAEQKVQNPYASEKYLVTQNQQLSTRTWSTEYWQKDIQQFYNMYRSMEENEKETFLRELSLTEAELVSVHEMTQKQWEVFLTNTLPLISSFVKKQEEMRETKEKVQNKQLLHQLEDFVVTQRQKSNFTWSQNEYTDLRNLRTLFGLESQEVKSILRNEKRNTFSLNKYGRKLEDILLEPMGLRMKNGNILENLQIYRFGKTINTLTTTHWKDDLRQFVHVYQSMETAEQETFLQELSLTDLEMRSLETMTKEQWEVFLTNIMPLISSYVKKQEAVQTTTETRLQKDLLYQLKELENIQQQNLKLRSTQKEHYEVWDGRSFSKETNDAVSDFFRNQKLENHQISILQKVSSTMTTERWQQNLHKFYGIYQSMETEEKHHFLEELSMTEAEMLSVRKMTKEQWEVFLTNTMPLISSYVKKQEAVQTTTETRLRKELLYQLKKLENIQQQNLKFRSTQKEHYDVWDLRSFSKVTNYASSDFFRNQKLENHQISILQKVSGTMTTERWQRNLQKFYEIYQSMEAEEKHHFLEELSMTEAEMLSVRKMTKEQWEVFLTNTMPLISSYVKKQEAVQNTQKILQEKELLRYVNECTETQWQDLKSLLLSEKKMNVQNLHSFFKETQQENLLAIQNWTQEKHAFVDYVQKHQYVSLLHSILSDAVKIEQKEISSQTNEEKTYSESVLREMTEGLEEWLSYLTENQWQEIKDVLVENSENVFVKPILKVVEGQVPAHAEPVFSAEKRGLISYLAEHTDISIEIIHLLQSKESLKNSMETWVTLPAEAKTENEHKISQDFAYNFTDEQILNASESLTEWLSYLTENQWQEVKSVLTVHQNEEYISPFLEMVNQQKPFEMEPAFSAEKRGAMMFISQNKHASAELIKILIHEKEIEKNLSEWVDLTPWKKAQESANKTLAKVSALPKEEAKNNIDLLTKFMSSLTKSQWKEIRETAATHHQYMHLQPILTLSKTQEAETSFETEKKTWIDHITENETAASEFLNLIQENRNVNLILQNLQQKAGAASPSVQENSSSTQISLHTVKEHKKAAEKIIVQQITNWLQQMEAEQDGVPVQKLKTTMSSQTLLMEHQTAVYHPMNILQKRNASEKSADLSRAANLQNHIVNNGISLQTVHHFSGVMNQDVPENTLLQPDSYGTAQMVIVKKSQGSAMLQTPPKIPEVVLEAKKAMQAEVHDIITRTRSQEPEQADNKTVLELMRRLDVQQKEIEKIRSTQKQMLNITDISIVTEKIMNQMQSQLRLEKMRRGL